MVRPLTQSTLPNYQHASLPHKTGLAWLAAKFALVGSIVSIVGLLLGLFSAPSWAQENFIVVASTTSTEQSGLFKHLLPAFTQDTGIEVRVVALGTGQALDMARRGDADVAFVHDLPAEQKFIQEGFASKRFDVMYNDFVIIGPKADPAQVSTTKDVAEALSLIAKANAPFISRGDKSGTHAVELRIWAKANLNPKGKDWYKESGQGMGPSLNMASSMNAYLLADRGTWLSFRNRGELTILLEGDAGLFNQYGVMLVNPERHLHVKQAQGQAFINWLLSTKGQQTINNYKIEGQQLFFANAKK